MSEKYNERLDWPRGHQKAFILKVQKKLNASIDDLACIVSVNPRTIRDWRREKFLMSVMAGQALSTNSHISLPKSLKIKKEFWYTSIGGKIGGPAVIKKYGRVPVDPVFRNKRWQEWWNKKGKVEPNSILLPLPFQKPRPSPELAEFFGIMMGDGGISKSQAIITLHHIDDFLYGKFVVGLIKKLFKISPSVLHYPHRSVNNIVVSRSNLVLYLHSQGLPVGDKMAHGLDIPVWIKNNAKYRVACLRGLVDTDGCVFTHKYKVQTKWYSYKKIDFTSASGPLRESVLAVLKDLGMSPSVHGRNVRLNSKKDVARYMKIVGTHNPKHLKRYRV